MNQFYGGGETNGPPTQILVSRSLAPCVINPFNASQLQLSLLQNETKTH